jgi:hypothetical protein
MPRKIFFVLPSALGPRASNSNSETATIPSARSRKHFDTLKENDMNKLYATLLAAPLLLASAMPISAQQYHHHRRHHATYYRHGDRRPYHGHGVGAGRGALIGGAGGAVVGGALGGGKGALIGGALGAGGGALAGKAHQDHMRRDYNDGRPR